MNMKKFACHLILLGLAISLTAAAIAETTTRMALLDVKAVTAGRGPGRACDPGAWEAPPLRSGTGSGLERPPVPPPNLTLRVFPSRTVERPGSTEMIAYLAGPPELLGRVMAVEYVLAGRAESAGLGGHREVRGKPVTIHAWDPGKGTGLAASLLMPAGAATGQRTVQATVMLLTSRQTRTVSLTVREPAREAVFGRIDVTSQ